MNPVPSRPATGSPGGGVRPGRCGRPADTDPPPLVGRVLLRLFVPGPDHEYVAGDLLEELRSWKEGQLGRAGARRWYLLQTVRSAGPFLILRLRRGEWSREFALACLLVPSALLGMDAFWGLVLTGVPLRAEAIAPEYVAASGVASTVWAGALAWSLARWPAGPGGTGARAANPSLVALGVFVLCIGVMVSWALGSGRFVPPWMLIAGLCLGTLAGGCLARARGPLLKRGRQP